MSIVEPSGRVRCQVLEEHMRVIGLDSSAGKDGPLDPPVRKWRLPTPQNKSVVSIGPSPPHPAITPPALDAPHLASPTDIP